MNVREILFRSMVSLSIGALGACGGGGGGGGGTDCEAGTFCACTSTTDCPSGEECDATLLICVAAAGDVIEDTADGGDVGGDTEEDVVPDTAPDVTEDVDAADATDTNDVEDTIDATDVSDVDAVDATDVGDTSDAADAAGRTEIQPVPTLGNPWIAYVERRPSELDRIAFIRADGTGYTRMETGEALTRAPAWSLDGTLLAYIAVADGGRQLRVVDVTTGEVETFTPDPAVVDQFSDPCFSPWGTELAFEGIAPGADFGDIYILDLATGDLRVVTDYEGADAAPTWTADDRIYFVSDRSGSFDLYSTATDGSAVERHTSGENIIGAPAVSLFGNWYFYAKAAGDSATLVRYYVPEETTLQVAGGSSTAPTIAADERSGAFATDEFDSLEVALVSLETGSVTSRVTNNAFPDSSPAIAPVESSALELFWPSSP